MNAHIIDSTTKDPLNLNQSYFDILISEVEPKELLTNYRQLQDISLVTESEIYNLYNDPVGYRAAANIAPEDFNKLNEMEDLYRVLYEVKRDIQKETLNVLTKTHLSDLGKAIELNISFEKERDLFFEMVSNSNFDKDRIVYKDDIAKVWLEIDAKLAQIITKQSSTLIPLIRMDNTNLMGVSYNKEAFQQIKQAQKQLAENIEVNLAVEVSQSPNLKDKLIVGDAYAKASLTVVEKDKKNRLVFIIDPKADNPKDKSYYILQSKKPFRGFVSSKDPNHKYTNREKALDMFKSVTGVSKKNVLVSRV